MFKPEVIKMERLKKKWQHVDNISEWLVGEFMYLMCNYLLVIDYIIPVDGVYAIFRVSDVKEGMIKSLICKFCNK